jgi:hypothetical protein
MNVIKHEPATPEQTAEFDAWVDRRPKPPSGYRPVEKQVMVPFGIGLPLFGLGFVIGMVLGTLLFSINPVLAFLIGIAMPFIMGMVIPVAGVVIAEQIYGRRYDREMRSSGWADYDLTVGQWEQEGYEKFKALAQGDYEINIRLGIWLDDDD